MIFTLTISFISVFVVRKPQINELNSTKAFCSCCLQLRMCRMNDFKFNELFSVETGLENLHARYPDGYIFLFTMAPLLLKYKIPFD